MGEVGTGGSSGVGHRDRHGEKGGLTFTGVPRKTCLTVWILSS
jgi:hypothetical protein